MQIEIRARIRCHGHDEGRACEETAETWADASLSYDGDEIEKIDVQLPKGWALSVWHGYHSSSVTMCPTHAPKPAR